MLQSSRWVLSVLLAVLLSQLWASAWAAGPAIVGSHYSIKEFELDGQSIEIATFVVDFDQDLYATNMMTSKKQKLGDARGLMFEAPAAMVLGLGTATFTCGESTVRADPPENDGPPLGLIVSPSTDDPSASLLQLMAGFTFGDEVYFPRRWGGVILLSQKSLTGELLFKQNFTKEDFATCNPTLHFAGQQNPLMNVDNETITASAEFSSPTQPNCTFEGMVKYATNMQQLFAMLKSTSSPYAMGQLEAAIRILKIHNTFVGCSNLLKSFATFDTSTVQVTTDMCPFEYGTTQFSQDPCCNRTLSYDQCCAPRTVPVPVQTVSGFDKSAISASCGSPGKMFALLTDSARAFNRISKRIDFSPSSQWRTLTETFEQCRQLIFSSSCKVDNDCPTKACDVYSGRCIVPWGEQYQYLLACLAEKMSPAIKVELRAYWNLPLTSPADPKVEGQEFLEKMLTEASAYDCVGPRAYDPNTGDQANAYFKYERNETTGNYETIYVPGNETKCLSVMGCSSDIWRFNDASSCTNYKSPKFCGECYGSQCWEVSEFPKCMIINVYDSSTCASQGGDWINDNGYTYCKIGAFDIAESECLDESICPPPRHDNSDVYRCTWTFCYSDVILNETACHAQNDYMNGKYGFHWEPLLRNGSGLCINYLRNNQSSCQQQGAGWHFYNGRYYQPGRYFTKEKCDDGACSIWQLRQQGATKSECEAAHYCTMNCERCVSQYETWQAERASVCFTSTDVSKSNCSNVGGIWTDELDGGVCIFSLKRGACESAGYKFASCDDYNKTTCSQSQYVDQYFNFLKCSYSYSAECKTQEACEAVGRCDDEFELTTWTMNGAIPGSCIFPYQIDNGGWPHCGSPDGRGQQKNFRWTRLGCAIYDYNPPSNESDCTNLGGKWYNVSRTKQECLAHGSVCDEPNRWDNTPKSDSECTLCGGKMVPMYAWREGSWLSGYMRKLSWKSREWAPVNEWKQVVQDFKFQEVFQVAVGKYLGKVFLNNVLENLSLLGQLVYKTACDCGTQGSLGAQVCWSGVVEAQTVECTARPNTTCGGLKNLANTIDETLAPPTITGFTFPATQFTTVPDSARKREIAAIGNSAQYAVVTNSTGGIVGQLVGDGEKYTFSVAPAGAFQLCLTVRSDINQDSSTYPVKDFANATVGDAPAQPQNMTITVVGDQFCATLQPSHAGHTFYPIVRMEDYEHHDDSNPDPPTPPVVGAAPRQLFVSVATVVVVGILSLFWL